MNKKTGLFLIVLLIIILTLNAEDAVVIRENTNFNYSNNSLTLEDGVVSVWSDTKTSVWNLYAQKIDATGNKLWNNGQPLLIDEYQGSCPGYTQVVKTNDNCIIIAWVKFFNPDDYRLYAQKINSSGQILWSQYNELILQSDFYPHIYIAANEVGGTYIYYRDEEGDLRGFNLDANASDLWEAFTVPILTDVGVNDVSSDKNGGIIINYNESSGNENLMTARINFNREILWNEIVAVSLPSYYYPKIVAVGSNDFIIWWRCDSNIIGQRFDLEGNKYWGDEGIQINNQPVYDYSDIGLFGSENSFFLAYAIEVSPPGNNEIFKILKFDLDGNSLWDDGTVLSNSSYWYIDCIADSDDNCVLAWNDNNSIFMQKVDSDGNKLWCDEGVIVASEFEFEWTQGGFRINELVGQVLCTWQPIEEDKSYLKFQALDADGSLLFPEDGIEIQSGNYSYIDQYKLIGNDESSYCLWEDYRLGQKRIFAQRVAPNGMNYFPADGIAITDTAYYNQDDFVAVALPEGGVALAWSEMLGNEQFKRVRWQILTSDGMVLSPSGFNISIDVTCNQIRPRIDVIDGNIIIVWLESNQLKAQKLVNYTPVWESNGSLLLGVSNEYYYRLSGNFILFNSLNEYYFQRIDENGNLASGWPYPGISSTSSFYDIKDMHDYNGDLIYTWCDSDITNSSFGFQILSSTGEYQFPGEGCVITENGNYYNYDFLFDGCINLVHQAEAGYDILVERYDLEGNAIWDEVTFQNNNGFHEMNSVKMGDNLLVTRYEDYDNYSGSYMMNMVDSNGNVITSNLTCDDFPVLSDRRDYQIVSVTDTDASVLFKRGYDVGSETTFFLSGLVSYQVNISDVPIGEDEIVNTAKCQLSNYPNPFNPTTTISFNLIAKDAKSAEIGIYNLKGQKVRDLSPSLCHPKLVEGRGEVIWDGTDQNDKPVSSGIYFYRLKVDGKTKASRKCLLLK
jgi:hypothetical protein